MAAAPWKSNALIMSMMISATRHSSGALPCRSFVLPAFLPLERGIQRRGESGIAAHHSIPGELLSLALALRHELQPLGRKGNDVGPAVDGDLALERLFELCCHSERNSWTSAGSW